MMFYGIHVGSLSVRESLILCELSLGTLAMQAVDQITGPLFYSIAWIEKFFSKKNPRKIIDDTYLPCGSSYSAITIHNISR